MTATALRKNILTRAATQINSRVLLYRASGLLFLAGLWAVAGIWLQTTDFGGLAPLPALSAFTEMTLNGDFIAALLPSLERIFFGLLWATAIGIPAGLLIGKFKWLDESSRIPVQFLRMISPLSWMPVAVMIFATWEGAIVFLIAIASLWPVMLSTAAGVRKVDPAWLRTAENLGAGEFKMITKIILPAVAGDIFNGLRLALGVAWIVIVPAEFLGVTSGLGYSINDARDTLSYDRLAALVVLIGITGYLLDSLLLKFIRRYAWHD